MRHLPCRCPQAIARWRQDRINQNTSLLHPIQKISQIPGARNCHPSFICLHPGERWVALQTGRCSAVERLTFIRKEVTPFPYHENEKVSPLSPWRKEQSSKFYLFAPGERWVALQTGRCSAVERLTFIRKEVTPFPYHENEKVSPLSPWRMQPGPCAWRTCAYLLEANEPTAGLTSPSTPKISSLGLTDNHRINPG